MKDMGPSSPTTEKKARGIIGAVIVLAVMALALIIFVMVNERTPVADLVSQTQTALGQNALLTGTVLPCDETVTPPVPINPVVNVNGIVIMGGALVLIVLAAVLREALLNRKDKQDL